MKRFAYGLSVWFAIAFACGCDSTSVEASPKIKEVRAA
jgi:hypothetical protein